jgi:hypothetical protein
MAGASSMREVQILSSQDMTTPEYEVHISEPLGVEYRIFSADFVLLILPSITIPQFR